MGPGGTIQFNPGQMILQNVSGLSETPGADKLIPSPLASILNTTSQFSFTPFQTPLGSSSSYSVWYSDATLTTVVSITIDDFGNVSITLGPVAGANLYQGLFVPDLTPYKVHVTVDSLGVPRIWIDDNEIPLVFIANFPTFTPLPANSVAVFASDPVGGPANAIFTQVAIAAGILPETTVFCC
jgi:hypothetical protein